MKKKIYVFMAFSTNDWCFTSSVHNSLEEARQAQMDWLKETCEFYQLEMPTKEELMKGTNDDFYYNEDNEYLSTSCCCDDEYSTIEIHEIELQAGLQEYSDTIILEDGKEYYGTFRDGHALLTEVDVDKENAVLLTYPHLEDLTLEQIHEIEDYTGRQLTEYFQIAVKYGKTEQKEQS